TDKKRFQLFGHDGCKRVLCKNNASVCTTFISPTMKLGGGSFIVWRCFFSKSVGL
ncbi:hypothetical protein PHYBLDRAFT_113906, partial [Phycomyces blakesleeanus NRRL 1555(-)]